MDRPLIEVSLELQFPTLKLSEESLQYFYRSTNLGSSTVAVSVGRLTLRSTKGVSYSQLKEEWNGILESFIDIFQVKTIDKISLSYLNEIPLEDLLSFQNYLNISIDMPASLRERFEFFRSEFIYKYDFGEIRVWLQPEWDENMDCYSIQLNLESSCLQKVDTAALRGKLQELHDGIKDVFHQIVSSGYIKQLPQ